MSFYGGNQNGGQPGSAQQQQMGRQQGNPGIQNVQQVLTPQLFNLNVNPNQLHNFFNEHNSSQNTLQQLNAAAGNPQSILLQTQHQQTQSFPVNIINDQLGVGVGQLITPASVPQSQMQGLPISLPSALNFQQTIHQVHAQTAQSQQSQAQSQQSKQQRVFTGTVTKVHDNFGFIDEEVFFQVGVVKGPILPKEGDRVLVEADFNASMPFKWNATRVQIVNMGGGMSSSLNSMANLNSSQHSQAAQHNLAFNTSMGMQKQSNAPVPQNVHTSQTNAARPHGQPVSIVSNPHSVYSGGNNPRGRTANVVGSGPPPVAPLVAPQREPPKRPMMSMQSAPEPPPFINNSVAAMISDREREMERAREAARERSRERSRERMRERERSRERARPRSRERSRERQRNNRSREREKLPRARSRSRDRPLRDRSRDRNVRGTSRDRSRERTVRDRSLDRGPPPQRLRSRSRERERNIRDRTPERRDGRVKRDPTPDKPKDRDRDRGKDRDRDHNRKKSPTPTPSRTSKDDPKRDARGREKEKDRPATTEKSKVARERSPPNNTATQSSDRSRRSRSKDSVRTDKGQEIKSRSRSGSPKRKGLTRPAPRYAVEIPKISLDMKDVNAKEIHRRYPNLYVPSDFFLAKSTWMDTFPLHSPFELGHACPVQIMRKGVHKIEVPNPEGLAEKFKDVPDVLEPSDASFIFKAKVMIPSMNSLDTIFKKACGLGDGTSEGGDSPQHIDRLINFIVGMKTSKHEVMALGGPWSPSLDGANPHSDPQTLINTAIRCSRALAGINLSRCKTWYRFMELYYKRSNCLETVVFFLPDVWSCLPDPKEWSKLKSLYKYAVRGDKGELIKSDAASPVKVEGASANQNLKPATSNLNANGEAVAGVVPSKNLASASTSQMNSASSSSESGKNNSEVNGTETGGPNNNPNPNASDANVTFEMMDSEDLMNSEVSSGLLVIDEAASPSREDENRKTCQADDDAGGDNTTQSQNAVVDGGCNSHQDAGGDGESMEESSSQVVGDGIGGSDLKNDNVINGDTEPEPKSVINPKAMNVVQLREQLTKRNLSAKGLKAMLITRLTEALEKEAAVKQSSEIEQNIQDNSASAVKVEVGASEPLSQSQEASQSQSVKTEEHREEEADGEHGIRLVDTCLIFENQDEDEDDLISMEDGELKEDPNSIENQREKEFEQIFAKFPPNTFPIIKPGMKEEEIKMWERRYLLPKNPRILVYPSTSAKGGNFDCISMSLGLLRDYRIIDKKEDSFEVSLFSEFFHEMLQRDFAFRIYREIVTEAGKSSATEDVASSEKDTDEKPDKDASAVEPATKRRKLSTASSVTTVSQTKKVTDPYLHLSFVFFDVTRCGYITETDLEDLCCCIGIGLTRAQVRKVVSKVVHKGTLYYRKWTERQDKSKPKSPEEIRILAQGNLGHFPVFVLGSGSTRAALTSVINAHTENDENAESVVAVVDGRNVDVKKLLEQIEKYEKDLAVAESSLNVVKNSLNEAKSQVTDLKKSNESQKEELTKVKEALKKSESSEKSAKETLEVFKRSSERYIDRIKDFIKLPSKEKEVGTKDAATPATASKSKEKIKPSSQESNPSTENDHKDKKESVVDATA